MDLPAELQVIHQPVRLGVMAALHRERRVRFVVLRDALGLTDGNLATHVRRLEEAGLVRTERAWGEGGIQMFVAISPSGAQAVVRYADHMRRLLAGLGA